MLANHDFSSLFGSKYDERRYKDVLDACALNTDLDLLEGGGTLILLLVASLSDCERGHRSNRDR